MTRRHLWTIIVLLALGVVGVALLRLGTGFEPISQVALGVIDKQVGVPTSTSRDREEIFKKAFWRRPGPDDKVLQAERHEWSDDEGVNRWQWFLLVNASPDLITYLRERNVFGLQTVNSRQAAFKNPKTIATPNWFRFNSEEVDTLESLHGEMKLMFSKTSNTLYATSSGRGFSKGVPERRLPIQAVPSSGRIPSTPPPRPK
ncbi:MAG: hypothetical protein ACO3RK_03955 [Luteolibacter sp.]